MKGANDGERHQLFERVVMALAQERQLLYALIGADLTVIYLSSQFERLLAAGACIGQPLGAILPEFVGYESELAQIARGEQHQLLFEQVHRTQPDGSVSYWRFRIITLDNTRPSSGLLFMAEDTTEAGRLLQNLVQERNQLHLARAELEQAYDDLDRVNRMKSLFLSMAAHDMRTPLTVIGASAELSLLDVESTFSRQVRGNLDQIILHSQWLNQLISDVLALDQIERGQLWVRPETCDLNQVVADAVEFMHRLARRQDMELKHALPDAPTLVEADEDRLRQVLYNLIGNAVKYTAGRPDGRVQVAVTRKSDSVVLEVSDNGPGMDEDAQAQLFQLYYRTESAQESHVRGTGLGLYIVKSIVEAHQGQIAVQSKQGAGTVFTITLPLAPFQAP